MRALPFAIVAMLSWATAGYPGPQELVFEDGFESCNLYYQDNDNDGYGNPATAMNLADVLYRRGDYERARFYVRRVNGSAELRNAESLWLGARIENRLSNPQGVRELGNQLRSAYPTSREAAAFERGALDD